MQAIADMMDQMQELKDAESQAQEVVQKAVEAAQKIADECCSALELKLAASSEWKIGAVRAVGKASSRGHTHRIAIGDACFPTSVWTTVCGWRFGALPHVRVDISEVNCSSCAKYVRGLDLE